MFKLLGMFLKTLVISMAALIAGNLLTIGNRSVSDHVKDLLHSVGLKPVAVAEGVDVLKDLPDGAKNAASEIKRAWDGVPKSASVNNGSNPRNPNPHSEDHPPAAQKDLKQMLQDLREANSERNEVLKKSLE